MLGISGSLRRGSNNTALLRAAAEVVPEGVELALYDGLRLVPPYDQDDDTDDPPAAAADLRAWIAAADGLLFATPEYNGSIPGQLKNAVDWASRPPHGGGALWGKPAAVLASSTGAYGGLWAQAELKKSLGIAGARVVQAEPVVPRAHEKIVDGIVVDDEVREQLAGLVGMLVAECGYGATRSFARNAA